MNGRERGGSASAGVGDDGIVSVDGGAAAAAENAAGWLLFHDGLRYIHSFHL